MMNERERRREGALERGNIMLSRRLSTMRFAAPSLRRSVPPSLRRSVAPSLPCFLAALIFLALAALACPAMSQDQNGPPVPDEAQAAADLELVSAIERVVGRAIAKAERSVVSVARRKRLLAQQHTADFHPGISRVMGALPEANVPSDFSTGVIIDASGLVLTNNHVLGDDYLENEYSITTVDRKTFDVKVKASDATSDLAVLEVVSPLPRRGEFAPIELGDAATLKKGQIVIALGNPYGIARDGQASASWGIVANLSRKAPPGGEDDLQKTLHELGTLIQTDARLNLGTSGGALVNVRGQMVGLTTSLAAVAGFEQAAGYAIPVDKAFLRIIQVLKEGREVEYGMLGITLPPNNSFRPRTGGAVQGVVINDIVRNGPAWKAKLQQGDTITHIDGKPIYDFDGLRLQISKFAPESKVTLTVVRPDMSTSERKVVLGKLPINLPQTFTEKPAPWRGATIDYRRPVNRIAGQFFGPNHDELSAPGVAVREIEEDTPAWEAGLRQGMLITHVGSIAVEKPSDFYKAVSSQAGAVKLTLLALDGSRSTVTVAAE